MVTLNGINVVKGRFPNNELDFVPIEELMTSVGDKFDFKFVFESNEDFFVLQVVKKAVDDNNSNNIPVWLDILFFPYEQMDRPMSTHLFSLKYVAQIINDLKFNRVTVADPHSHVLEGVVNNLRVYQAVMDKDENGKHIYDDYDLVFYPDNGAAKKYSEIIDKVYRFGNKRRDLDTGKIVAYDVIASTEDIKGKKILMVDDLVMGGRTFCEAAGALKNMGAKVVDVYVTHLMPQARNFYNSRGNGLIRAIHTCDTLNMVPIFETP